MAADPVDYREQARATAVRHGLDPETFLRLVGNESRFNPRAVSPKGAVGLGQLMPGTASDLGVDPRDPLQNLEGSARYLRQQLDRYGDYPRAVAAYNAGPGNVDKYGGVPPFQETKDYVAKVAGGGYDAKGRNVADLGRIVKRLIRAKYPGVYPNDYQNIPDDVLGRRFREKFPAYSGFTDLPGAAEAAPAPPARPQGTGRPVPSLRATPEGLPETPPISAVAQEHYAALPPLQKIALQFSAQAQRMLPGAGSKVENKFPEPSTPGEQIASMAGGVAGFTAVAVPATAAMGPAGPIAAAVGLGATAAAAPGTEHQRIARGVTFGLGGLISAPVDAAVASLVSKNLVKAAPDLAQALNREAAASVKAAMARGVPQSEAIQAAQDAVAQKIAQAVAAAKVRTGLIRRGAGAVAGAATFGVAQPVAENVLTGEPLPKPKDAIQSGLQLLAVNVFLEGHAAFRAVRTPGVKVGEPPPNIAGGHEAARANIKPPPTMSPNLRLTGEKTALELGHAIDQMNRKATLPIKFEHGGLTIQDAHIVPNLIRYFPGDPNPVRVTVVDRSTGKMHSVQLASIGALRAALAPGPRPLPPGLEAPPAEGLPAPKPVETKVTVPGQIISPEQYQAVVSESQKMADEERAAARNVGASVVGQLPAALGRIRNAPAAIAALERQIAERPGDKNINRWKRRLAALKKLPGPPVSPLASVPLQELVTRARAATADADKRALASEISKRTVGVSPHPADVTKASSWTSYLKKVRAKAAAKPGDVAAQDEAFRAEQNFEAWKAREAAKPKARAPEQPGPARVPPTREAGAPPQATKGKGSVVVREPTPEEAAAMQAGETRAPKPGELVHKIPPEIERRISARRGTGGGATSFGEERGAELPEARKAPGRRAEDIEDFKKGLAQAEHDLKGLPKWDWSDLQHWWSKNSGANLPTENLDEFRGIIRRQLESIVKHGNEILGPPATFAGSMRKGNWTPAAEIGKPKTPAAPVEKPAQPKPLPEYITENRGRWFTDSARRAGGYGHRQYFVDVPQDWTPTYGSDEYVLPKEYIKKVQPLSEAGPIPDGFKRLFRGEGRDEAPPAPTPPPKAPRRELGKFERGDLVTARRGNQRGFVLASAPMSGGEHGYVPLRYRVRWETGHESDEFAKALKVRVGSPRATEEQLKRIEAAPEPQGVTYNAGGKRVEPPPRPEIEREIIGEMEGAEGLRPVEDLSLKPSKGFRAAEAMATSKYFSDHHLLLVASEMEPKVRERVAVMAAESGKGAMDEKLWDQVIEKAIAKPSVKLEPRGWAHLPSHTRVSDDVAAFYDPKSDRLVIADAQKWKFAVKAIAPDSYEQHASPNGAIVMRRGGKFVALLMPLRLGGEEGPLRAMLGAPAKEAPIHESRMAPAKGAREKPRRTPGVGPPPSKGRGIPIQSEAPAVPTEAEAATLPKTPLPQPLPDVESREPSALEKARTALKELVVATNPVRYAVGPNLDILMKAKGGPKKLLFRAERTQRSVHAFWEKRSKEQVLDFLVKYESGGYPDPRLEAIAESYRDRNDNRFAAISRWKNVPYWENYFPHLWKRPKQVAAFLASRRPMEGSKRFLKPRVFEDTLAALQAGFEPVTWNLEDMMMRADYDAWKFVALQEALADYKANGSAVTLGPGQEVPEGFRLPDQRWAQLYLNPNIEIKEAFDARIMAGLESVARAIGTRHERKVKIKEARRARGFSQGRRVVTRFATPESVLAHEIGHQLDHKYGLQLEFLKEPVAKGKGSGKANLERRRILKELRALADLRFEGHEPPEHYKAYVRSGAEKMAVMLEALIHAPQAFKETAPHAYLKFVAFLASHEELVPLLHLKPSLLYGSGTATVSAGGIVLGKRIYMEENLARILDNHMSRDYINESTIGRGVMVSRNTLNAINLGLSGFHATGTTLLAMMTRMSVGFSEMAAGRPLVGLGKIVSSPIAPYIYVRDGWKFYKGSAELMAIEDALFHGGASLERKAYYRNEIVEHFVANVRQAMASGTLYERLGHAGKAIAQLPFVAIEGPIRLLTNYYIPQMKVGAFRDLFSSQLRIKARDIAAGKTSEVDVARLAWRDVEDRFGLINYDNEFWNNTLKAAIMVLIRAPGWTLGTTRALGGAAFADLPRFAARALRGKAPDFTPRMAFALAMTFTTMMLGAIYQLLHTGKWPETLEDYLHPKNGLYDENGKPMRISFPTFMKDVEGWLRDPVKELVGRKEVGGGASSLGHGGKLAPEITLALDLLENQSYRGPIHQPVKEVKDWWPAAGQTVRYIYGREQPFALSQIRRTTKEGGGVEQALEGEFGLTRYYAPQDATRERRRFREVEQ